MKLKRPKIWLTALTSVVLFNFHLTIAESAEAISKTEAKEFFAQKVQPLLQQKCLGCHGEDKDGIEGELDMSTREGLLKGGESKKPSLVPGKPEKSPMYLAI